MAPNDGGGGGGGRIAVYYTTSSFTGMLSATGGSGYQVGGAGTIFLAGPDAAPFISVDTAPTGLMRTPVDHVDVVFTRRIDRATFTADDVYLWGPAGEIQVTGISLLAALAGRETYRISFPLQNASGAYRMSIGPNITGANHVLLDQDHDGNGGEAVDDVYVSTFTLDTIGPRINRQSPAGDMAGTIGSVDVWFSEPIQTGTLTVADVAITGPGGTITPTSVTGIGNNAFRISFSSQTQVGQYHLLVGPQITDLIGNPMDQNRDDAQGQPEDAYQGTFQLVDVDLEISNLAVGATELWANDTVQVSWNGANTTGYELMGSWTDAVYLSGDDQWDTSDVLLATVPHSGGLAQGETYSQSIGVNVPGKLPGDYYLIVRTDIYGQEKEASGDTGNNVVPIGPLPLQVRVLPTDGAAASGMLNGNDRSEYYSFQLLQGQGAKLILDADETGGANEVYVRRGEIPTRQTYDCRAVPGAPDATLTIPPGDDGGTYYVLVYADQVTGSVPYQLRGLAITNHLSDVTPNSAGKQSPTTLTLTGAGFDDQTQVELVGAGGVIWLPTSINVITSTQMTADVDVPNLPVGSYSVRVTHPDVPPDVIAGAFTVSPAAAANLTVNLVTPSVVGFHMSATLWIEYSNTGDAPMPAPLFKLQGTQNAFLTLDSSLAGKGLWTDTPPTGVTDTVTVWATGSGATPGILQPGDTGRIPVYYLGLKLPWDFSRPPIEFSVSSVTAEAMDAVDWTGLKSDARPEWIAADAWDATWSAFTSQMGATWGQFVERRAEIVNYLAGLGQDSAHMSMDEILAFAIVQSSQAGPGPILASAVDAYSTAPGIPLVFGRVFSQSPEARYRVGTLGHGWSSNWDYSVQTLSTGDAVIHGPGGADRFFTKGQTAGTFTPLPGDYGTLTYAGGLYSLKEKDGTVYKFRSDSLLDYVQDTNANRVTCGYASGRLTSLTHSNGDQILIAYNGSGRIATVTDPLGPGTADDRITTFTYDGSGTYLLSVTAPGSRVTTYTYQTTGAAPILHSLLSVGYPDGKHSYFGYDPYGRVSETHADGGAEQVTYSYESFGVVTAQDAAGVTTVIRSGSDTQPGRLEVPGSIVRAQYDETGEMTRLTGPEGQLSRFSYDDTGNLVSLVDPARETTTFEYDPTFNQPTDLTDARGNNIGYTYDAKGNLTRITYEDGTHEDFSYDAAGNVLTWTNRRGQAVTYTYDSAGELTSKDYPDTPGFTDYVYAYDAAGNLTSATDVSGTTSFTYQPYTDYLLRIDYLGGKFFTFEYDTAGRRTKRTDQDGYVENYSYDTLGRLDRMTDGSAALIVDYDYDAAGRMARKTLGNGVYTTYEYDAAGQLTHLVNYKADATVLSRFDYTYNASGQQTSMSTLEGAWTYGYDASGQLTSVTYPDSHIVTYAYDAVGNRTTVTDSGTPTAYTTNSMNQYTAVGAATYTFDADGNMATKTEGGITTAYTYNIENRLVGVTTPTDTWTYSYDAFGQRIASTHNGAATQYVIDPIGLGNVAAEYDGSGNLIAHYDHGYGLVAQTDPDGSSAYYTFSAIGNTSELTSATGTVLNVYSYDPFGISLGKTETVDSSFEFVGEYGVMKGEDELTFMRSRYYVCDLGRFTVPDTLGLSGGDFNLYRYVENSPLNKIDPLGYGYWVKWSLINENSKKMTMASRNAIDDKANTEIVHEQYVFKNGSNVGFDAGTGKSGFRGPGGLFSKGKEPGGISVYNTESAAIPAGAVQTSEWFDDSIMRDAINNVERRRKGYNLALHNCQHWADEVRREYERIQSQKEIERQSRLVGSIDPNDKIGPAGYGQARYVQAGGVLSYEIQFENKADATAPAQRIVVTDVLDGSLDLSTLELTEIAFANRVIVVPAGLGSYQTTLDLRPEGKNLVVEIDVSVDKDTRMLTATLMGIDPSTGWLPEDMLLGILYPNDSTGRGDGHINYTVKPLSGLASGTEITNKASIVFDWNDPIDTPMVHNALDASPPASEVDALPAVTPISASTGGFTVTWSGIDDADGSGLASYDIYVSDNDGPYTIWKQATTDTSATFLGEHGHTYSFYSVGRDNVGLVETAPGTADATTLVQDSTVPMVVGWFSAATHGTVGEVLLSILDNGTFSEPRGPGIRRLVVQFTEPIAQASFTSSSIQIAGHDVNGNDLDLSGITITTSTRNGGTEGVIDFSQALPNVARYTVRVQGVTDLAGNPLAGENDRVIGALVGDATGDGVVDAADYIALKRAFGSNVSLANASIDFDCSGMVDWGDLMALQGSIGQSINVAFAPELPARATSVAPSTTGVVPVTASDPAAKGPEPSVPSVDEPVTAAAGDMLTSAEPAQAQSTEPTESTEPAIGPAPLAATDAIAEPALPTAPVADVVAEPAVPPVPAADAAHADVLAIAASVLGNRLAAGRQGLSHAATLPTNPLPPLQTAVRVGPLPTFHLPLLSCGRARPVVADVLQLAAPWWSGNSAGPEAPDEPWMTRPSVDILGKPRKGRLDPVGLDVLAVSR